jgi:antitoxin component YwqK of YwqJK toxin-antitoxin module
MRAFVLILIVFLVAGCSYKIEPIMIFLHSDDVDTIVPSRYRPYLTKKEINEFERGSKKFDKYLSKIQHRIYYVYGNDTLYKASDGYFYTDAVVGKLIAYYPNGKMEYEENYVMMNDSTKEVIGMDYFNKIKDDIKKISYNAQPDGTWKYYSEDGKLIKEVVYDKGKLVEKGNE